jgi:hypothetical protein
MNQVHRGTLDINSISDAVRRFSDRDPEFVIECVSQFVEWYLVAGPRYRSWEGRPEGIEFGLIKYRLPSDARVALIGDWGTGLDDARAMLTALLVTARPAAVIHLGDVYYSGTPQESRGNFVDVIDRCCQEANLPGRIPVFNLAGNHDYYSGGLGFYDGIDSLNEGDQLQQASYFCLRTEDDRWQFLGLDTGRHDHVPGLPFEPFYRATHLEPSEVVWAADKLNGFKDRGQTILLTHHQLFSARSALNGSLSFTSPFINHSLLESFTPHFAQIAIWFWGHEHSLALFKDGSFGLRKGRLLGCSAFEALAGDGYETKFAEVEYEPPVVKLGKQGGWLNHGCAVIDLGQQTVDYYQFPSSGGDLPQGGELSLLATEQMLGGRL